MVNFEAMEAVNVVNVNNVLHEVLGERWLDASWDEECTAVKKYCADHNAHFYGKPREDFNEWEARREAVEAGKSIVVVEDMS